MPQLKKDLKQEMIDQIIEYAKDRSNEGASYAYTYKEIADVIGNGVTKDDISAVCLQHNIRRKVRGTVIRQTEDSILAEIKQLHEKLSVVRQRVVVVWTLTGKKFSVENCQGKSDREIIETVRHFLTNQRANRDGLH